MADGAQVCVLLAPNPLGRLLEMPRADLLASGSRRRKWQFFPPLGSYAATWSLRSHQGYSPRDREAGNPHVPILQGLGDSQAAVCRGGQGRQFLSSLSGIL